MGIDFGTREDYFSFKMHNPKPFICYKNTRRYCEDSPECNLFVHGLVHDMLSCWEIEGSGRLRRETGIGISQDPIVEVGAYVSLFNVAIFAIEYKFSINGREFAERLVESAKDKVLELVKINSDDSVYCFFSRGLVEDTERHIRQYERDVDMLNNLDGLDDECRLSAVNIINQKKKSEEAKLQIFNKQKQDIEDKYSTFWKRLY